MSADRIAGSAGARDRSRSRELREEIAEELMNMGGDEDLGWDELFETGK